MRLIDADVLKSYIDCGHLRPPTEMCFSELDVIRMLDRQPTIDAEPVRHADWFCGKLVGQSVWYCTRCGYLLYAAKNATPGLRYCPNCGAKMDTRPEPSRGCATCANDGMDMPQCRECIEHLERPWYRPKDGGAE